MKRKLYCLLNRAIYFAIFLSLSVNMHAQDRNVVPEPESKLNYGFGLKLVIDFGFVGYKPKLNPKKPFGDVQYGMALSASIGIGYAYEAFIPTYHLGFRFSQGRGMLGNSGSYNLKEESQFELINAFHFIIDWGGDSLVYQRQFQYFTSHHVSSMFINSKHFVSVGTILISNAKRRGTQRSGSIGFALPRFSLYYTNDGGAGIGELLLGDRWDRYWNGGITAYFKVGNDPELTKDIVLSYDRFTGFSEYAYRYSGQMKFDYVSYENETEKTYNKGVWKLTYRDHHFGLYPYISLHDFRYIDLQHMLHKYGYYSYHPNFLNWSIHAGGSISNSNSFKY